MTTDQKTFTIPRPMRMAMMEIKARFEQNIAWFEREAIKFEDLALTNSNWYGTAQEMRSKAALVREMKNMVLDELSRAQATFERESILHALTMPDVVYSTDLPPELL